jgi:hypothetical protein
VVIPLGVFAHQPLGPLLGFVSQVGEARFGEVPGSDLQMLGPLLGGQIALRTGSLRPAPLGARSLQSGTLRSASLGTGALGTGALEARTFGSTRAFIGAAGPVRAVAAISQLLQPALGRIDGPLGLFAFRCGGLAFGLLPLASAQLIEVAFDLVHLPLAHFLHPPVGSLGLRTVAGTAIVWSAIVGTAILRTASLGAPILHPTSFARTTLARTALARTAITRTTIAGAICLGPPTLAWRRAGGATPILNELLFGGQLGLRPDAAGIARRILGRGPHQTNSQHQPQIPRHVVFLPVSVSKNLGE